MVNQWSWESANPSTTTRFTYHLSMKHVAIVAVENNNGVNNNKICPAGVGLTHFDVLSTFVNSSGVYWICIGD